MAKRINLNIDILHHINQLTFEVYRSLTPNVQEDGIHIMNVIQELAIKERKWQTGELLERHPETPYAFRVKRHYETDQIMPKVFLDQKEVNPNNLFFLSDQKEIEIHSGEVGVFDGRPVYMDYEYITMPVLDDYKTESGKEYFGPPATGLHPVTNFKFEQDLNLKKIWLTYTISRLAITYYYQIIAKDTAGNKSPWSDVEMLELSPEEIYFRIQRSPDGNNWDEVIVTTLEEWYDILLTIDNPTNVQNAHVFPRGSKEAVITFDNPWFYYTNYPRTSYQYRVRAEDDEGMHTDWVYFGPITIYIEPKEILIRRKINNNAPSSKDKTDAFTVFRLTKNDVDITQPKIYLTDNQLTDASVYSYTFFYTDELDKEAQPFFLISDHLPWKNIILFNKQTKEDYVYQDFMTTFELANEVIEIGIDEEEMIP